MATKLILIRHGQTEWNLNKKYCGLFDIKLNAKGKMQAECLRKRLKKENVHKVYSSDRKRAIETAKIIFKELEIEKMPDLREMHFGCFEGLTYREIMQKYPKVYKKWLTRPFAAAIPQGESLGDFKKRIVNAFKKIVSSCPQKTVAVVCHGGVIAIFLTHILKTKDFFKLIPACASLSILEYKNGKPKLKDKDG